MLLDNIDYLKRLLDEERTVVGKFLEKDVFVAKQRETNTKDFEPVRTVVLTRDLIRNAEAASRAEAAKILEAQDASQE